MRVIHWLLCVVTMASSALAAGQSDTPKPEAPAHPALPNVILITMDTTRADRMGFLGSKRGLTPNLDALALDAGVFTRAYSQAPLTPTSHASILTGTFPQYHQVLTFLIPLAKELPYLPSILKERGYTTAAFVGSLALDPVWGVPGFERGFDTYTAGYTWEGYSPEKRYETTEHRAGVVVQKALDWLAKNKQGPFFLWVHVYDPHAPYDPPPPYKARYAKEPYDGEIAYADAQLGKLFKQLKASGLYDNTLIAMTADHGESLGAHGELEHGIFIYDDTIHVPLLIKLPGKATGGKKLTERVELVDIMPTVLQSAGIAVPETVQGQSLLGLLTPGTPEGAAAAHAWHDRGAYSQGDYAHTAFAWSALQSLRAGKYLFIQAPRRELYDDGVDPKAEHNLAGPSSAVADTLSTKLEDFKKLTTNTGETPRAALDSKNANKLAALGYMASRDEPTLAAAAAKGAWPDPKDKIQIANTILKVNAILQDFHCEKAIPVIKEALVADPTIAMLHFFLGGCYMDKNDYEHAIPEYRKTVELDPAFIHAESNLGRALLNLRQYDESAQAFERVVKTDPNIMDAHLFLEIDYAKLDRIEDEIRECRIVLKGTPDHFGSNVNLGLFLVKQGNANEALPYLEKAVSLKPKRPRPHQALADAYSQLGRDDDAKREQAEVERLRAHPEPEEATDHDKPEN